MEDNKRSLKEGGDFMSKRPRFSGDSGQDGGRSERGRGGFSRGRGDSRGRGGFRGRGGRGDFRGRGRGEFRGRGFGGGRGDGRGDGWRGRGRNNSPFSGKTIDAEGKVTHNGPSSSEGFGGRGGFRVRGFGGGDRGQGFGRGGGRGRGFGRGGDRGRGFSRGGGGRGFRGGRGFSRGGFERGRGGGFGRRGMIKQEMMADEPKLVQGELKGYADYPGWTADEIHQFLQKFTIQAVNNPWQNRFVPYMANHSIRDCKALWFNIIKETDLTLGNAVDYVKALLVKGNPPDEDSSIPVHHNGLNEFIKDAENITLTEVRKRLPLMCNTKRAEYMVAHTKENKEYYLACFNYYKTHIEEFEDAFELSNIVRK